MHGAVSKFVTQPHAIGQSVFGMSKGSMHRRGVFADLSSIFLNSIENGLSNALSYFCTDNGVSMSNL